MDQPAASPRRGQRTPPPRWAGLPPDAQDRTGRPLALGDVVRIREGTHAGQVAEVVGWGGRRGAELVIHTTPPVFLAVQPALLELEEDIAVVDPVVPRDRPPPPD
jgi:hypothetical protein